MRKRFAASIAVTMVLALAGASAATAATEIGSNCSANTAAGGAAAISLGHGPGSPLPSAVPANGVITQWKVATSIAIPPESAYVYAQQLQIFRATPVANQYLKVGESSVSQVVTGTNSFPTRIPVQAGDRLGLSGPFLTFLCGTSDAADVTGIAPLPPGGLPVGAAASFPPSTKLQVPAAAVVEADGDHDGFGDETQDGCPQSAAYQTACPVIVINAIPQAGGNAVTLLIATSQSAPVQVTGSAKLGKGATAKLKAATVGAVPGVIAKVRLRFPGSLKNKLKELTPKQKVNLKITASAANLAGALSTVKLNVRLKGQG